jgi:hypothetical protein
MMGTPKILSGPTRRRLALITTTALLLVSGAAIATANAGASVLGEGDAANGRSSQEPLGAESGSTPIGTQDQGGQGGAVNTGGTGNSPDQEGVAGKTQENVASTTSSGGGGGGSLPFTGFVAIPVLVIGVALLSVGLILRRRESPARSA